MRTPSLRLAAALASPLALAACFDFGSRHEVYDNPYPYPTSTYTPPAPSTPKPTRENHGNPPPVAGGTLAVAGGVAAIADADRDVVHLVDLATSQARHVSLPTGSEPGRIVLDGKGRAHVALRRAGGVATFLVKDPAATLTLRKTCAAPRGLLVDDGADRLLVACAEGTIVSMGAGPDGVILSRTDIAPDLRDLVLDGGHLFASTFREARLLELDPITFAVRSNVQIAGTENASRKNPFVRAAFRMASSGGGGRPVIVGQQPTTDDVPTTFGDKTGATTKTPAYYGACDDSSESRACDCRPVVEAVVSDGARRTAALPMAVLPVDIAVGPQGYYVASAAYRKESTTRVYYIEKGQIGNECIPLGDGASSTTVQGQATAVAVSEGRLFIQTRAPSTLAIVDPLGKKYVALDPSGGSSTRDAHPVDDAGHALFHRSSSKISCASCHLEGGEDGYTWEFGPTKRRTPTLLGTLASTAPYHAQGEFSSLAELASKTWTERMGGSKTFDGDLPSIEGWLNSLPAPQALRSSADPEVTAGRAVFEAKGCATCHAGASLTDSVNHDGLQAPSLVGVWRHAPYFHSGCAKDLRATFSLGDGSCDSVHPDAPVLTSKESDSMLLYLESL